MQQQTVTKVLTVLILMKSSKSESDSKFHKSYFIEDTALDEAFRNISLFDLLPYQGAFLTNSNLTGTYPVLERNLNGTESPNGSERRKIQRSFLTPKEKSASSSSQSIFVVLDPAQNTNVEKNKSPQKISRSPNTRLLEAVFSDILSQSDSASFNSNNVAGFSRESSGTRSFSNVDNVSFTTERAVVSEVRNFDSYDYYDTQRQVKQNQNNDFSRDSGSANEVVKTVVDEERNFADTLPSPPQSSHTVTVNVALPTTTLQIPQGSFRIPLQRTATINNENTRTSSVQQNRTAFVNRNRDSQRQTGNRNYDNSYYYEPQRPTSHYGAPVSNPQPVISESYGPPEPVVNEVYGPPPVQPVISDTYGAPQPVLTEYPNPSDLYGPPYIQRIPSDTLRIPHNKRTQTRFHNSVRNNNINNRVSSDLSSIPLIRDVIRNELRDNQLRNSLDLLNREMRSSSKNNRDLLIKGAFLLTALAIIPSLGHVMTARIPNNEYRRKRDATMEESDMFQIGNIVCDSTSANDDCVKDPTCDEQMSFCVSLTEMEDSPEKDTLLFLHTL